MDNLRPWMRWLAIAGAAGALALAFFSPHHPEVATAPDDSPPPLSASPSASPAVTASPADLAVYVCGAVRKAGVYRVSSASRVVDAVKLAGGLSADADAEAINLAELLVDGMKVDVPRKGARTADYPGPSGFSRPASSRSPHHRTAGRSASHKLQPGQTVNINSATESELAQLPGVGPSLARRIIEYREANGPFQTPDDLQNVSGIGPGKFAKLEAYVRI